MLWFILIVIIYNTRQISSSEFLPSFQKLYKIYQINYKILIYNKKILYTEIFIFIQKILKIYLLTKLCTHTRSTIRKSFTVRFFFWTWLFVSFPVYFWKQFCHIEKGVLKMIHSRWHMQQVHDCLVGQRVIEELRSYMLDYQSSYIKFHAYKM